MKYLTPLLALRWEMEIFDAIEEVEVSDAFDADWEVRARGCE